MVSSIFASVSLSSASNRALMRWFSRSRACTDCSSRAAASSTDLSHWMMSLSCSSQTAFAPSSCFSVVPTRYATLRSRTSSLFLLSRTSGCSSGLLHLENFMLRPAEGARSVCISTVLKLALVDRRHISSRPTAWTLLSMSCFTSCSFASRSSIRAFFLRMASLSFFCASKMVDLSASKCSSTTSRTSSRLGRPLRSSMCQLQSLRGASLASSAASSFASDCRDIVIAAFRVSALHLKASKRLCDVCTFFSRLSATSLYIPRFASPASLCAFLEASHWTSAASCACCAFDML
mmetsp:Transcript_81942/g.240546  ORF Transcript_81942/g.240546 Transcript_81942/m.240546 type:complete len:292 (-) Transcript_81942:107-982(-)